MNYVPAVRDYAKTLPFVVYAEDNMYTCSEDTQIRIKEKIQEYNLNRVVVASCSPRTHEPLFRETVKEGGLNPHLFDMANIRDQCSWVHMDDKEGATEKAKDLVRMVVAKVALNKSLPAIELAVRQSVLIIGGGVTGLTAALNLALWSTWCKRATGLAGKASSSTRPSKARRLPLTLPSSSTKLKGTSPSMST
jgi:heterodisulfide reductase subunit A